MKLIIGQGNPGDNYVNTRHNVAWQFLDAYAKSHGVDFQNKSKFQAEIAEINTNGHKVCLVKPTTFYNETGRTVRALIDFYQLSPLDVIILHDDIALPYGTIRVRSSGSDAGNNGIKSITSHMATDNYWRLRIGIRPDHDISNLSKYVLDKFGQEDLFKLRNLSDDVMQLIDKFIAGSIEASSIKN